MTDFPIMQGELPHDPVKNSGVRTVHEADDPADYWLNDIYVLMLFHTDFEAETISGKRKGQIGQMMISTPAVHHWHRGLDGFGFINDWIHIKKEVAKVYLGMTELPLDEIFSVSRADFLGDRINAIQNEQVDNAPHGEDIIAGLIREIFLLADRYRLLANRQATSPVEQGHYRTLCQIRYQMLSDYSRTWEIRAMAKKAHLSPNRFSVLYRKFFSTSPIEDLIQRRTEQAKLLLLSGHWSVAEIAGKVGFSNPNYFSRVFRSRIGISATAYMKGRGRKGPL